MDTRRPILQVRALHKAFPGVIALGGVSLDLYAGEVLAVVGENGAGKSTLMKILAGVQTSDAGEILLDGNVVAFRSVSEAMAVGISLIHQELNLAENLPVSANLFLGREAGGIFLRRRQATRDAEVLLERVGLSADLASVTTGQLAPGQKQLVEIARALSMKARILIMDEPTSSLTQTETDRLYEVIDSLKAAGVAVIYISHRLAEVRRLADRVVVLRDGRNAGELPKENVSHEAIVRMMVGRDLKQFYPRTERSPGEVVLEVKNLVFEGANGPPISFSIRAGEIVGMAGLVGAGRTELAEAMFGIRPILSGEIVLAGKVLKPRHPSEAIEAGLLLVPEDRKLHGLVLERSVGFNFSLPNLEQLQRYSWIRRGREKTLGTDLKERLRVKTPDLSQVVGNLSGGNQQKIVLGKWLARRPKLVILDEPTRGVDVGARSEIYAIMDQMARDGVAVWMISSDLEEVLGMSDRVLVLHEGRLSGELPRNELSEEAVMHLATGGRTT